jgi:hypothetical protein
LTLAGERGSLAQAVDPGAVGPKLVDARSQLSGEPPPLSFWLPITIRYGPGSVSGIDPMRRRLICISPSRLETTLRGPRVRRRLPVGQALGTNGDHGRETTTWLVTAGSDRPTEQGRGAPTALVEGRVRLAERKSRQSSGRQAYAHRPIRPRLTTPTQVTRDGRVGQQYLQLRIRASHRRLGQRALLRRPCSWAASTASRRLLTPSLM